MNYHGTEMVCVDPWRERGGKASCSTSESPLYHFFLPMPSATVR